MMASIDIDRECLILVNEKYVSGRHMRGVDGLKLCACVFCAVGQQLSMGCLFNNEGVTFW